MVRVNINNPIKTKQLHIPQGGFLCPTGNRLTLTRVLLRDFLTPLLNTKNSLKTQDRAIPPLHDISYFFKKVLISSWKSLKNYRSISFKTPLNDIYVGIKQLITIVQNMQLAICTIPHR